MRFIYENKSFKRLNEGAGAGYIISGDLNIDSLTNIKITKVEYEKAGIWEGYNIYFNCDLKGSVDNLTFNSYMYGGEIDSAKVEASTGCLYLSKGDLEDFWDYSLQKDYGFETYEEIINEITSEDISDRIDDCHFSFTYGNGWTHVTYDGSIKMEDEEFSFTDLRFVDENVIKYIDKCVKGENISNYYVCEDEDYDEIKVFDDFYNAKNYAIENKDVKFIEEIYEIEQLNGDIDIDSNEIVCTRAFTENFRRQDKKRRRN